jgi:hypothetical protein
MIELAYSSKERVTIMKVVSHYHLNLLVVLLKKGSDEKSEKTQPAPSLRRSGKPIKQGERRRRRPRGLHQTRHPLFVTAARRKAITLSTVGTQRLVHFVGRKAIMRHLVGRSKPYATSLMFLEEEWKRRLLQSNNKLRGTWRGGVCQAVHVATTKKFFHH